MSEEQQVSVSCSEFTAISISNLHCCYAERRWGGGVVGKSWERRLAGVAGDGGGVGGEGMPGASVCFVLFCLLFLL